jgi:hypothetical protein
MLVYNKIKPKIIKNSSLLKEYFYQLYREKNKKTYRFDPRPELKGHKVIKKVLVQSYKKDKKLYNLLHYLRCVGLVMGVRNGELVFGYSKNSIFKNDEDFYEHLESLKIEEKKDVIFQSLAS